MLAYVAEIDRRRLYLEHACPSMFALCTKRFRMSEAIAAKRIRAGRAAGYFPFILGMVARGEIHLSGIHQLAGHLTTVNHEEVLRFGAKCSSEMRGDVRSSISRGGPHSTDNVELRCRAHNQHEAELDYGADFMAARRFGEPDEAASAAP